MDLAVPIPVPPHLVPGLFIVIVFTPIVLLFRATSSAGVAAAEPPAMGLAADGLRARDAVGTSAGLSRAVVAKGKFMKP